MSGLEPVKPQQTTFYNHSHEYKWIYTIEKNDLIIRKVIRTVVSDKSITAILGHGGGKVSRSCESSCYPIDPYQLKITNEFFDWPRQWSLLDPLALSSKRCINGLIYWRLVHPRGRGRASLWWMPAFQLQSSVRPLLVAPTSVGAYSGKRSVKSLGSHNERVVMIMALAKCRLCGNSFPVFFFLFPIGSPFVPLLLF